MHRATFARATRAAAISIAASFAAACVPPATTTNTAPAPKPVFSFKPAAACAKPASAGVAFAVVAPQWTKSALASDATVGMTTLGRTVFKDMPDAMRDDFFALLTCDGFTTKGPYASTDEMVFPDRKASDLILVPEIDIVLGFSPPTTVEIKSGGLVGLLGALDAATGSSSPTNPWRYSGQVEVSGHVTLSLRESLTDMRMWTKSIPLDPVTVAYQGETVHGPQETVATAAATLYNDPGVLRALDPKLEAYYQATLSKAAAYFDAREMQLVRTQSLDVRTRAGASIKGISPR